MTANQKVVSLPEVAKLSGGSLDLMRKNAQAAAERGLLFKIGSNWAAEAANASAVRAACEAAAAARRKRT